jgi:hypothetical protein
MVKNGICVKCDAEFKFARYADLGPQESITCKYCCAQMRKADAEAARDAHAEAKRQRRYRKWRNRHPPRWLKLWRRINPIAVVIGSGLLTLLWAPDARSHADGDVVVKILGLVWLVAAFVVTRYFEHLAEHCGNRSTVYWRTKRYLASCGMRILSFALLSVAVAWPSKRVREPYG